MMNEQIPGQKTSGRSARRVVLAVPLLLLTLFLFLSVEIYLYSFKTAPSTADAAIVLGAEVWDDRPSPVFEERIRHAIDLYRAGRVRAIVFTGGVGAGDRLAESEAARAYALARGVPARSIYCEARSRITYENLAEAKRILDREGWTTALVVSDPLHMRRAVTMARDLGIDAYPSPTPTSRYRTWGTKSGFLLRETYFYAGYLLERAFNLGGAD